MTDIAGHIDIISRDLVEGWLRTPWSPVTIEIFDGPTLIGTCRAATPRPDLAAAGLGPCAFSFLVPLHVTLTDATQIRLRLADTPLHLLPTADTSIDLEGRSF